MSSTDQLWFLAFVITPGLVLLGGYIAVRLHEWSLDKHKRNPAE